MTNGKKVQAKWVLPLLAPCAGLLLALLLMMPMLKMAPKNVPLGLLSLDVGVAVGDTQVNVGDLTVDKLLGNGETEEGDDSLAFDLSFFGGEDGDGVGGSSGYVTSDAVNWIVVDSEEELEELLSSGACYAALTIPADFSARMAASIGRAALGEQLVEVDDVVPVVELVINQGKNSMVSNSLASAISSMASGSGVSFKTLT